MVERLAVNEDVTGSSPVRGASQRLKKGSHLRSKRTWRGELFWDNSNCLWECGIIPFSVGIELKFNKLPNTVYNYICAFMQEWRSFWRISISGRVKLCSSRHLIASTTNSRNLNITIFRSRDWCLETCRPCS